MNDAHTATVASVARGSLTRRGLLRAAFAGAVVGAAGLRSSAAASTPSSLPATATDALLTWTNLTLALIQETEPSPPHAARALALVHVAMAEAARTGSPARADAITVAAATVLQHSLPGAENRVANTQRELLRNPSWSRVYGAGQTGLDTGYQIGQDMIAWARTDGSDAVWDGERAGGTGTWQPTPPAYRQDPLEPMVGQWRPWVLSRGDALRPSSPPAWRSAAWEEELAAVQQAVTGRTPEQADAARFWAGGPGTVTPAGLWIEIARDLIVRDGLDAPAAAEVLALTSVAMVDGFICCWDAKYAYWTARPITADPTLDVLIPTPPFPSYISGHSTISAAAATVLSHLFPADATRLRQQAAAAKDSRLWAGIHFPIDNEAGARCGELVGQLVIARAAEAGAVWDRFRG